MKGRESLSGINLSGVGKKSPIQRKQIHEDIVLRAELRRAGLSRATRSTGEHVVNCAICGAPLVDSVAARAAHVARMPLCGR